LSADDARAVVGRLERLAALTPARVGLGRCGASLPTAELLRFGLAHARARDAVHTRFDSEALAARIEALGCDTTLIESAARTRGDYLRRPDLGRRLSAASAGGLALREAGFDLAIVVADGLSAAAAETQAPPLLAALLPLLEGRRLALSPILIASQARVALADEAAQLLGARMALSLIGERPGLSSPDSLGAYLTYAPRPGLTDADRNCVSNIRPDGLGFAEAAGTIDWLIGEAFKLRLTGVALKDASGVALVGAALSG
jgi:ethanolamine ammonia-lyase small subunit